ncbi:MAG TPA: hypothetical protein DCY25_01635 [Bacteroidales bacterium]|nr:hypothetical protein [Bacteroidales bacterium]
MTILIRFVLISIIIYLLVRPIIKFFQGLNEPDQGHRPDSNDNPKSSGVSKEIGEYVDYEEVD